MKAKHFLAPVLFTFLATGFSDEALACRSHESAVTDRNGETTCVQRSYKRALRQKTASEMLIAKQRATAGRLKNQVGQARMRQLRRQQRYLSTQ